MCDWDISDLSYTLDILCSASLHLLRLSTGLLVWLVAYLVSNICVFLCHYLFAAFWGGGVLHALFSYLQSIVALYFWVLLRSLIMYLQPSLLYSSVNVLWSLGSHIAVFVPVYSAPFCCLCIWKTSRYYLFQIVVLIEGFIPQNMSLGLGGGSEASCWVPGVHPAWGQGTQATFCGWGRSPE